MTDCYDALVRADGATVYWTLDGDLLDSGVAAGGHDATAAGDAAPAAVAAPFGGGGHTAYAFRCYIPTDGTGLSFVRQGNWLDVDAGLPAGQSGALTWELWLTLDDLLGMPGPPSGGGYAFYDPYRWLHLDNLQGYVAAGHMHAGALALTSPSPDVDTTWHHWAATSYRSGGVWRGTLYLDGAPHATWFNISPWCYAAGSTIGAGQIGGFTSDFNPGSGPVGALNGAISRLALYPVALSDCQVASHYEVALGACGWPQRAAASAQVIG